MIFYFLPPLLFEAAWSISFKEMKKWWRIIGSFAFLVFFLSIYRGGVDQPLWRTGPHASHWPLLEVSFLRPMLLVRELGYENL